MDNRKLIALRSFIIAAGATAAASFVGVFAVMIGASAVEMGWLQSSSNSLSNLGQILWGRISDRAGRRTPFLILGSVILAILWYMLPYSYNPVDLIILYALISLFSAMITVNWYSFIADNIAEKRGHFLSIITNIASIGTVISLIAIFFLLDSNSRKDIIIPFTAASISYIASALIGFMLTEKKSKSIMSKNLLGTLKTLKNNSTFYQYFMATNVQSFFWSLAWPMFPITIVTIMGFSLKVVALLTIAAIGSALVTQYFIAKFIDNINRIPLIFLNKIMLSGIPLMYAFFDSFPLFIGIEIYSGFLGSIQNSILTSYTLDVVPEGHHAEYISILNGFNGAIYFAGALTGGYLLSLFIDFFPLKLALIFSYIIVFSGRFISSFLFRGLKEVGGGRNRGALSILFKPRQPGSPSGAPINPR